MKRCKESESGRPLAAESGRPLVALYFYITGGCNLNCRHCWIDPEYTGETRASAQLDSGLFKRIVDQALGLGLEGVKLTGGEPLLHDDMSLFLETIRLKKLDLTVETNGVLLTPQMSQQIAACGSPDVSVSLDSADEATHEWMRRKRGCFRKTITGIDNLVKAGISPQIIVSVFRRNRHQLEDVVRLAEDLGASSVKFNVTQPVARGKSMHEAGETLDIEELVELGKWMEGELAESSSIRIISHNPPAFRPMGRMWGLRGDGCSECGILNILGVLHDGSYALCGIGRTTPGLVFGNAAEDELARVWNENPFLEELRCGLPDRLEGVCGRCLMKHLCLGSCIAQNYYLAESLWAPFWYCERAAAAGLFPATRRTPSGRNRPETGRMT